MLIKGIEIKNFRQFKKAYAEFADGSDGRNVTLIMGENGTGKTTFEQAFLWCLYGKTEFKDKVLLNKDVSRELMDGEKADVLVCLTILKGTELYFIKRKYIYLKNTNVVKLVNTSLQIEVKGTDGNTYQVKASEVDYVIKRILPQELARYFFFDGEKIDKMSKDISDGTKSSEFSDAVNGLLGLNAIKSAIKHFNPRRVYGVLGSYENEYNQIASGNKELEQQNRIIEKSNNEVIQLQEELETITNESNSAKNYKDQIEQDLKSLEEARKKQEDREKLEKNIEAFESFEKDAIKSLYEDFSNFF